ncbi:MAG: hypothetical protein LBW77_02050 [Verrucomicrobiota bacterium]|jgi:hypothetical protein|nr:hypothetical protein [Verrucomicrobiota bacterium]
MPSKTDRPVLKPGTSSVFVGGAARATMAWRLDVREDASGQTRAFRKRKRPSAERGGRPKLFHYISAGGLRQLRRTTADDLAEVRRHSFLMFLGVLAVVWVVFYFLPSA